MQYDINPFPKADADRFAIWEMLVRRDIDAFLARDWSMVESDFAADRFFGIHAHFLKNPDTWRMGFPALEIYRDEWLRQAADTAGTEFAEPLRPALFRSTILRDIDIAGDRALVHKKFDGEVARADGSKDRLLWQTLYVCNRIDGAWKIASFVGYMANP